MRVLITGAGGQVGRALATRVPPSMQVTALTRAELDVAVESAVRTAVRDLRPNAIINAAAYTAVERAEREPEIAQNVNRDGAGYIARAAGEAGARVVHISTDFVFDGRSSVPYAPDSPTNPLNAYGRTKLEGERLVLQSLPGNGLVVRTSWVYAAAGRNFMLTILRALRENGRARVVADQIGTPTSARSLAEVIWLLVQRTDLTGIHHWTDAGVASWYDFAVAIAEEGAAAGLVPSTAVVEPIRSSEYASAVRRPGYGVLDRASLETALGFKPVHWRRALRDVIKELRDA